MICFRQSGQEPEPLDTQPIPILLDVLLLPEAVAQQTMCEHLDLIVFSCFSFCMLSELTSVAPGNFGRF